MGYDAGAYWKLRFKGHDEVLRAANLIAGDNDDQIGRVEDGTCFDIILDRAAQVSENFDASFEGLDIVGWSGGKMSSTEPDEFLELVAPFVTGTIDWEGEDGNKWRNRVHPDGTWSVYDGVVGYPGDPGE